MINNDPNNDEYKLDDLDLLASEPEQLQPEEPQAQSETVPEASAIPFWENPNIKKGLIIAGVILSLLILYGMFSALFSGSKKEEEIVSQKTVKTAPIQAPMPQSFPEQTVSTRMNQQLSSIQQDQTNLNSNIQMMSSQVSNMNNALSDLTNKMAQINNTIAILNEKIDAQSQALEQLKAPKKRPIVHRKTNIQHTPSLTYYIQAVIPGRAWLMSNNGTTLTVREGTSITGYGVVKLIDPEQGRVVTSSGRVIRFSQVDS